MNTKRILIIVIVLAVLVAAFFGLRSYFSSRAQRLMLGDLQTEKARIGALEATIGATGIVRANQSVFLNWQTSGTVDQVYVTLGDQVQAGDKLAELRQNTLSQQVILAQADLVNAQNALDSLLETYEGLALATAEQNVARARDQVDKAQQALDDLTYEGEEDDITEAYKDLTQAQSELDKAEYLWERYKTKPGTIKYFQALQRLNAAQDAYRRAFSTYNYLTGASLDDVDLAIAKANLAVAQETLAQAEDDLASLQSGPDADDVAAAEARVAAAEATLKLAWIETPFDGIVTLAKPLPGDQVSMGSPAFRVDDLSHLLVDVQVSEVDINRVQQDQEVVLTFDAILAKEYSGTVVEVSPVGSIDQGVVNFQVTVELTNPDEQVKPGMTAAVNIVVSELENVLLVPNRAVRVVEGKRIVYVLRDGEMVSIEIVLGASADLYSEVIEGDLTVGDEIILNPPAYMDQMSGPPSFMRN